METIFTAVGFMTALSLTLAVFLIVANKNLYVFEDPHIDQVEDLLPHANWGSTNLCTRTNLISTSHRCH